MFSLRRSSSTTHRSLPFALTLTFTLVAFAPPTLISIARAQDQGQGIIQMQENQMGDDERAKAHFRVGTSLYESGRFNEAAEEWQKAFELSQRSELLYNVYVAYRDAATSNDKAIAALRKYLELGRIEATRRLQLEARLRAMEEAAAQNPTAAAPAETTAAPETAAPAASEPQRAPVASEGSSSVLPIVLIAAGGALIVTSVITGLMVNGVESKLEDNCPNDVCPASFDREGEVSKGNTLIALNAITGVTGVLAAGVGVVLLALGGGDESPTTNAQSSTPSLSLGCGAQGCTGALTTRF